MKMVKTIVKSIRSQLFVFYHFVFCLVPALWGGCFSKNAPELTRVLLNLVHQPYVEMKRTVFKTHGVERRQQKPKHIVIFCIVMSNLNGFQSKPHSLNYVEYRSRIVCCIIFKCVNSCVCIYRQREMHKHANIPTFASTSYVTEMDHCLCPSMYLPRSIPVLCWYTDKFLFGRGLISRLLGTSQAAMTHTYAKLLAISMCVSSRFLWKPPQTPKPCKQNGNQQFNTCVCFHIYFHVVLFGTPKLQTPDPKSFFRRVLSASEQSGAVDNISFETTCNA